MRFSRISVAAALAALSAGPMLQRANAQCDGGWLPGGGATGVVGYVCALTMWDPDGPGPRSSLLVVGGNFTIAGNAFASNIAVYDPSSRSFSPLSTGTNGTVHCLAARPNGDLIVGGAFTAAGNVSLTTHIARWNGSAWTPLETGASANVNALAALPNGDIVAAGDFNTIGGHAISGLAKWNGTTWGPLGPGATYAPIALRVLANGDLLAATDVPASVTGGTAAAGIARWNGMSWSALSTGLSGYVSAIDQLPNGDVIVGGNFTVPGVPAARNVARWNGSSWSALGSAFYDPVIAISAGQNGEMLLSNYYYLSRWNGSDWSSSNIGVHQRVNCFAVTPWGTTVTGSTSTYGLEQWDTQRWSWLGLAPNSDVGAIVPLLSGEVAVTGGFSIAGGATAQPLMRSSGSTWVPIDLGEANSAWNITRAQDGSLAAARRIVRNGVTSYDIASWNGSIWTPLTSECPFGPGLFSFSPNGQIVISGTLYQNGQYLPLFARWDGQHWTSFGGPGLVDFVRNMAILPDGKLIAWASPVQGVVFWNGSAWVTLGLQPTGFLTALTVLADGEIVASFADFTNNLCTVSQWNGSTWTQLGPTLPGTVSAVAQRSNGDIFINNASAAIGNQRGSGIAIWKQGLWQALDDGPSTGVKVMVFLPSGDLAVGGNFLSMGSYVSESFARYHFGDLPPSIWLQPSPAFACPSSSAAFRVLASGGDHLSYQWQARSSDGVWRALGLAPAAWPCGAVGTATPTDSAQVAIHIQPCPGVSPSSSQSFNVRCVVSNSCGSFATIPTTYITCPADFNCSNTLSVQDIFDFLNAWFALNPRADMNASGTLDQQDVLDYAAAWFTGC